VLNVSKKQFSNDDKIKYYQKRANNSSLTPRQQLHARQRLQTLNRGRTGLGMTVLPRPKLVSKDDFVDFCRHEHLDSSQIESYDLFKEHQKGSLRTYFSDKYAKISGFAKSPYPG